MLPNPRCLQILDVFRFSLPSDSHRLQILAAFESSPPPNPRCLQILADTKSSLFPNRHRHEILDTFESSLSSSPLQLQTLAVSNSSPPPNPRWQQNHDSSKSLRTQNLSGRQVRTALTWNPRCLQILGAPKLESTKPSDPFCLIPYVSAYSSSQSPNPLCFRV